MASFSVATMLRESREVAVRFASYYLDQGAEEVLLYFDGPAERIEMTGVEVIECAWEDKPETLEACQSEVYARAHKRCKSEWLLVLDADEFVFGPEPTPDLLARVPKEVDAVRVPTAEAVWGPGDDPDLAFGATHFRTRLGRLASLLPPALYGGCARKMKHGLMAHSSGKSFLRTDRQFDRIRCHTPVRNGKRLGRWAEDLGLSGMYHAHFDAISFERWQEKWRRRRVGEVLVISMQRWRKAQMRSPSRECFRRYYVLNKWQYGALKLLGAGFRREIFKDRPVTGRAQSLDCSLDEPA